MSDPDAPVLDGRDRSELLADLRRRADQYTRQWDPEEPDNGTALLRIFSDLATDVLHRLDDVPEKHRLAFLDALDFDRRPPQAARLPLSFEVSDDLERNVRIPGGTRAVAEDAEGTEQLFELPDDAGFEATPASVTDVVGVVPEADRFVEHDGLLEGEPEELFVGENRQRHVLYLGGDDLLTLRAGSPIHLEVESPAGSEWFREHVAWEFYGAGEDGEPGWQPLERAEDEPDDRDEDRADLTELREELRERSDEVRTGGSSDRFEERFVLPAEPTETTVGGVESRWVRCRLEGAPADRGPVRIDGIGVRLGRDGDEDGLDPDGLLANDVPLANDGEILPFGRMPQPPATLHLACEEALTKRGAVVGVEFRPSPDAPDDEAGPGPEPDDDADPELDAADGAAESSAGGDAGGGTVLAGPPNVSWEYWNGNGWAGLDLVRDGTDALRESGRVEFRVPADFEQTSVSGHEDAWIRARLVGGSYGDLTYSVGEDGERTEPEPDPPRFGDVSVHYEGALEPFDAILTDNNGSIRAHDPEIEGSLEPFEALPEGDQTLYLGFDAPLENGPIPLYLPVADATYPRTFDPGVRWEYCDASGGPPGDGGSRSGAGARGSPGRPADEEWSKLEVRDHTAGLTERGVVLLNVPERTEPVERFGRRRHWIRARVTQDEFDVERSDSAALRRPSSRSDGPDGASSAVARSDEATAGTGTGLVPIDGATDGAGSDAAATGRAGEGAGSDAAATGRAGEGAGSDPLAVGGPGGEDRSGTATTGSAPAGEARSDAAANSRTGRGGGGALRAVGSDRDDRRPAPVLEGIHPNTQFARNARTVAEETLGSSDGSHDQSFDFAHAPVIEAEVWVDEASALSSGERRDLERRRPDDVERVTDARGETTAFWVRWRSVTDFLDSGPDDRHYVLDRTGGTVRFGDSDAGAIPPSGQDNVRATYATGGGRDGNVGEGTITSLKSSVSLVEAVDNPRPADGGADAESTDALVDRTTARIRHRGRAVCPRDFEEVARAEFRELSRVRAMPGTDAAGEARPGWVTLLVVPQARRERPVPSVELKQRVGAAVAERAPATLARGDADRIVVRGPRYAAVDVSVTVRADGVKSVSVLKQDVERALESYLHPLTGDDGDGWAFGEAPTLADVASRIERPGDLGRVVECSAVVRTDGESVSLVDRDESARLSADALVCSGRHDVGVTMEGSGP